MSSEVLEYWSKGYFGLRIADLKNESQTRDFSLQFTIRIAHLFLLWNLAFGESAERNFTGQIPNRVAP